MKNVLLTIFRDEFSPSPEAQSVYLHTTYTFFDETNVGLIGSNRQTDRGLSYNGSEVQPIVALCSFFAPESFK